MGIYLTFLNFEFTDAGQASRAAAEVVRGGEREGGAAQEGDRGGEETPRQGRAGEGQLRDHLGYLTLPCDMTI